MEEPRERPKGYRFSKAFISHAVYVYHRFLLSYRDVTELLFERNLAVLIAYTHEPKKPSIRLQEACTHLPALI